MTRRRLQAASVLVATALAGCGACSDDRETRRIDLGVERSRAATAPAPAPEAASPAGEEVAAQPPPGEDGEPAEDVGDPNAAADRPADEAGTSAAATSGTPATGVGAAAPQKP